MGLDIVEMVMEVEAAFDVEIPDAEAAHLTTVGQLYVPHSRFVQDLNLD